MCLQNNKGEFVQAKTVFYSDILSHKQADIFGLLEAIYWLLVGTHRVAIAMSMKSMEDNKTQLNLTQFNHTVKPY